MGKQIAFSLLPSWSLKALSPTHFCWPEEVKRLGFLGVVIMIIALFKTNFISFLTNSWVKQPDLRSKASMNKPLIPSCTKPVRFHFPGLRPVREGTPAVMGLIGWVDVLPLTCWASLAEALQPERDHWFLPESLSVYRRKDRKVKKLSLCSIIYPKKW